MVLYRIKDFDPDYRNHFDGDDVKDLDLYSGDEKIGSVDDVLVDEEGHFRYLVINTGVWIFGKKVLLPVGRARIDYNARRAYADGLTKEQVEQLPEFTDAMKVDYNEEERIRNVYRSPSTTGSAVAGGAAMGTTTGATTTGSRVDTSRTGTSRTGSEYPEMPVEGSVPVEGEAYTGSSMGAPTERAYAADVDRDIDRTARPYDRDTYQYDMDADLYNMPQDNDRIRLYEERVIANKRRQKTGEVSVGKHVETKTDQVSVPVEKERVVIERTAPTDTGATVSPGADAFHEGEVARMEVYEETPDIHKEAFVREEVRVKKVVDHDTVTAEEQVRREELDVDSEGRPIVDNPLNRDVNRDVNRDRINRDRI